MVLNYKLIIFDFDGTLADSFPWALDMTDRLAEKYKLQKLDRSELDTLRRFSARELMKYYAIPFWKMAGISKDVRHWMSEDIQQIRLFPGITPLLAQLADQGVQLALVTSNSLENVQHVLGAENAARIAYYECGVSLFGKRTKLKKVLQHSHIAPSEAICIGDEIRDIQAAQKVKIPFGAVAWGFTQAKALAALHPEEVFASVEEMAACFGCSIN